MLINKMMLYNYKPKYSFKSEEKNDYNSIKKEILNNKIFEIRENTKQYNKGFSFLSALSMAAAFAASDKEMYKAFINIPNACLCGFIYFAFRPLVHDENYKKKTIETPLKKEEPLVPILSSIAAGAMVCMNWINDKLKTPEAKLKNAALAALVVGIGCLHYYVTNKNVAICESEVKKYKSQST